MQLFLWRVSKLALLPHGTAEHAKNTGSDIILTATRYQLSAPSFAGNSAFTSSRMSPSALCGIVAALQADFLVNQNNGEIVVARCKLLSKRSSAEE